MNEEETTIKEFVKDEAYCMWYKCEKCGDREIMQEAKYCHNCGRKIIKEPR